MLSFPMRLPEKRKVVFDEGRKMLTKSKLRPYIVIYLYSKCFSNYSNITEENWSLCMEL